MKKTNLTDQNSKNALLFRRLAASLAALAVALGAFGAHALKSTLEASGMMEVWNTAHFYHFAHSLALYALALSAYFRLGPSVLLLIGILLFSGSLYGLALTDWSWLGPVTPIGGVSFIAGWIWLAIAARR